MEIVFLGEDGQPVRRNFLVGENGTGKSSVLRAAALVLAGSDALPELISQPGSWVRNGAKSARVTAEIQNAENETRSIVLTIGKTDGASELIKNNAKGLAALDAALKHTERNYFMAGYGASRRLADRESPFKSDRGRSHRTQAVATLFDPSAEMSPLESWATNIHYQKGDAGLDLIRAVLKPLLNGLELETLDKRSHQLIFNTPDGLVPLRQLSDGFQNMVAWCGDLLARLSEVFGDYKNPFAVRGLLLVDEIDLHLHPQWQRQLLDYLRETFSNFQLIATSHSPLTVQQCGPGEVVAINREPGKGPTAVRYQADLRRLRVEQIAASPIFGLGDTISLEAEKRISKTPRRKTKVTDPVSLLSDLPVPGFQFLGKEDLERVNVLRHLAQALTGDGAAAVKASKRSAVKTSTRTSRKK